MANSPVEPIDQRLLLGVVNCPYAGRRRNEHDVVDHHHVANPVEPLDVELDAGLVQHLVDRRRLTQRCDHRPVLGSHFVEPVRRSAAAGARHILRNNGGLAGDMVGDEAGEQAGIQVIATTRAVADDEADLFAAVKIGYGIGGGRQRHGGHQGASKKRAGDAKKVHTSLPA